MSIVRKFTILATVIAIAATLAASKYLYHNYFSLPGSAQAQEDIKSGDFQFYLTPNQEGWITSVLNNRNLNSLFQIKLNEIQSNSFMSNWRVYGYNERMLNHLIDLSNSVPSASRDDAPAPAPATSADSASPSTQSPAR